MKRQNNSSLYVLSIVGVVVIGVGIWWLVQSSVDEREPETSLEIESAPDVITPESVVDSSVNTDAVSDIPNTTTPNKTGHSESPIEVEADSASEVPHDTASETPSDDMPPLVITMDSAMYFFTPNVIRAKLGQRVVVNVTAKGNHDFVIDELGVRSTTPNGETTRIAFTAEKVGTFAFYCSVSSHRALGQVGTLIVTEA